MPIIFLLLNSLIFFKQEVFGSKILWGPDSPKYFFPFTLVLSDWLKSFHFPLWSPYIYFGFPLASEGQMGLLYPPNWIHLLLSPSTAINLLSFLHFFAAGLTAYYFARTIKLSKIASTLVAISYMFSGQFISHMQHLAILYEHPYLPLILALIYKGVSEKRQKLLLIVPILLAIQNFAGHPNIPIITTLFSGLFLVYMCIKNSVGFKTMFKYLSLVFLPFVLLTLPRIADSIILISQSLRSGSVDFIDTTNGSLSFFDLITYFLPNFFFPSLINGNWVFSPTFHFWTYWGAIETVIYIGIPTVILSFFSLKARHPLKTFFLFLFFAILLISFGRNTPLYQITIFRIPILGAIRDPSRYMYFADFCLIVLAGMGLDKLLSLKKDYKKVSSIILIPIIFITFIAILSQYISSNDMGFKKFLDNFYLPLGPSTPTIEVYKGFLQSLSSQNPQTALQIVLLTLSSLSLCAIILLKQKAKQIAAVILLVILSFDLLANTYNINIYTPKDPLINPPTNLEQLRQKLNTNQSRLYTFINFWSDYMPNQLLAQKIMDGNGSSGMPLRRFDSFQKEAEREWMDKKTGKLLSLASVQVVYGNHEGKPELVNNEDYLPRAYLVQDYLMEKNINAILPLMKQDSFDPRSQVILEENPEFLKTKSPNSTLQLVTFDSVKDDQLKLTTSSPDQSILVLTDTYYPGWKAKIDNQPTKIYRANFLFKAIILPPGSHRIEFYYQPTHFYLSLIVSLLTLLSLIFYMFKKSTQKEKPIQLSLINYLKLISGKVTQKHQLILIAFITPLLYFFLSPGPTNFNYYTRLSQAFLSQRIFLNENPSWLNELIPDPRAPNRYYVAYPPMPAIVSLPFVLLDQNISQTHISIIFGSLNAILMFLVIKKFLNNKNSPTAFWITLLFAFGTNHFFLSTSGSAWYFAHIVSVFFLLLAIYETLNKKRPLLIGLLIGASYWSRLPTILSLPFFLLILKDCYLPRANSNIKNYLRSVNYAFLIKMALGIGIFLDLNFIYNFLRFGTIIDIGYTLIPNVLSEPWYRYGIFNIRYIPQHLKLIFTEFPAIQPDPPYIKPSYVGMSIFATTPALLLVVLAPIKKLVSVASWTAIILISLPSLMHGTVGFSQFGYRFAMDYTPFLILLTTLSIDKQPRWYHKLLIILSIVINLWGVVLNKTGLVTF